MCQIDIDMNLFLIHEIKIYDDAKYFICKKIGEINAQKQVTPPIKTIFKGEDSKGEGINKSKQLKNNSSSW